MSKTANRFETFTMTPSEVYDTLRHMSDKKTAMFVWGPPGIAKSSIIRQLAEDLGMDFIDIRLSQMDPTDLRGIPYPTQEEVDGKTVSGMRWSAPLVLPRDKDAKAIILLDEFNSAAPSVQAGAYQLVLDRKLGEYEVPEGCMIVAAGNRETDKGITFRMPTPIANRFVHIEMRSDFDDWQRWALNANIDKDVVGYLTAFKSDLFSFDAASATRGFPTPRSWEFVSRILDGAEVLPELVITGLVSGAVGDGVAIKFMQYRKNSADMPNPTDILDGKVTELRNTEVSLCYSLTTALCYELKELNERTKANGNKPAEREAWLKKADNFLGFMLNNFQPEVTIMGAKTALSVFKLPFEIRKMKNFEAFTSRYSSLVFA